MTTEILEAPQTRLETDEERAGREYVERTLNDIEVGGDRGYERNVIIIDGAAGQNAEHAAEAFKKVQLGGFALHALDIRPPANTPHDVFHNVGTEEGQAAIESVIDSGAVRAAYLSRVPKDHEVLLEKYLTYVIEGKMDYVVMPKPVVETPAQARHIDVFVKRAREALRLRGIEHEPLLIHEHYLMKGGFNEAVSQLNNITPILGRLSDVSLSIQEQTTIEAEGREAAVAGGTIEDLAPHLLSMMLAIQSATNAPGGEYEMPRDFTDIKVNRARYRGAKINKDAETGFTVKASAKIIDRDNSEEPHPLSIRMSGGKGLVTKKEVVLTFAHPETGVETKLTIDLGKANEIVSPPAEIAHLFDQTTFRDNGYDEEVARGLLANPNEHFQSWNEAHDVVKMLTGLQYLGTARPMYPYTTRPNGISMELLEKARLRKERLKKKLAMLASRYQATA